MTSRTMSHAPFRALLGSLLFAFAVAANAATLLASWGQKPDPAGGVYLSSPVALAMTQGKRLYVADLGNSRIVEFEVEDEPGSLKIKVDAVHGGYGQAPGRFNMPFGVTVDRQGYILVGDTANYRVQKFDSRMRPVLSFGSRGNGPGQFELPREIAVDSQNRYYISDEFNHRIQVFDSNGNFLRSIGSYGRGGGQFRMPQGVAIDAQDNLFVADTFNHRVQKLSLDGTFVAQIGMTDVPGDSGSLLHFPRGVNVDAQGNVFIADTYNHKVKKFNAALQYQYSAGGYPQPAFPAVVLPAANGVFYVSDTGNNQIIRYKETAQGVQVSAFLGTPRKEDGQFSEPNGVTIGLDGRVYVADRYNHRIQVFDANGNFLARWGKNGGAGGYTSNGWLPGEFNVPSQMTTDAQGRIYVADAFNSRVQVLSPDGQPLAIIGGFGFGPGQFLLPTGVAVDPDGNVFVVDWFFERVHKFNASFQFVTMFGGTGTGDGQFRRPTELGVDAQGNVYVVDVRNSRIQKFDNNGVFLTKWGTHGGNPEVDTLLNWGKGDGDLFLPLGIRVAGDYVYVNDGSNYRIQKFDLDGNYVGQWGRFDGGPDGLFAPTGIAVDAAGHVYITDLLLNRVLKFAP